MKILVTGGCGFLGSNLVSHAIKRGDDVVVFDNLYRNGSQENLAWLKSLGTFKFVHGDIRNNNDVRRAVRDFLPEGVFHLAGQVAMTTSIIDPRMDFEVNMIGSFNLLESILEHVPEAAVVYSSTNKVYGDLEQYCYCETETRFECVDRPNGFDETTPLEFHSPYGCSKGAADQYMLDYFRTFGLKTVVFRHSSMYGGRQFSTFDQGWIGWFCRQALDAKKGILNVPFTISGNGKQVRDLLHADDMVELYFASLDRIAEASGQAFNIGGGLDNSLSLLELFKLLEARLGVTLAFTMLPPRESDQKVFVADTSKAERVLGWHPKVSNDEGIDRLLKWIEYGA